ncbi:hypothetical protein BDV25DRAFT_135616 [Aspergillus avenaceus]|uniref:RING-type domain-containing protein n=1 Tax=Aspergillus avenaceus TaxID=36643 RepID=A0A5N6U7T6_ASPAV|nr:hypothetical protein BDV25DRAFT_135616 [Aspergillus avenaceus]
MGHHCTVCRKALSRTCLRNGHYRQCGTCEEYYPPSLERDCPHCRNKDSQAEKRMEKEVKETLDLLMKLTPDL